MEEEKNKELLDKNANNSVKEKAILSIIVINIFLFSLFLVSWLWMFWTIINIAK